MTTALLEMAGRSDCVCPWCDEVLMETSRELLQLRVAVFRDHRPVCPKAPDRAKDVAPPGGYGAAIAAWSKSRR